jgi:carboxyl-terminal processing protease
MTLSLRGVLVLLVGVVLGLGLALSTTVWTALTAHPHATATSDPTIESAALIAEVIDRVRREYVDRIDEQRLVDSAIRGIVSDLDQHSSFLSAEQYEAIRITTSGNYTGIGLDVNLEDGKVTVVSPLEGAPAARAGILPGDVVVSVDDTPVDENDVSASVARMRGPPGTAVTLAVVREGAAQPLRFALTRTAVQVKSVAGEYLGNGIVYLRLSAFTDTTARDLDNMVRELTTAADIERPLGVVLDLRGNPGGVLDAAVRVADAFLPDGLIVSGTGRVQQARFEQYAHPGGVLERVPAVVLVNHGSASASEIVAGALKDHHRAHIVGETTYGKGSVQTVMPLGEGTAIKLTTSRYLTPSGRSINGSGIEPDVVVHNADANREYRGADGPVPLRDDAQLFEALRLISYDTIAQTATP